MHVKWKIFYCYVKNYEVLSMFALFQILLWSLFPFLENALWFHFSENGPIAVLGYLPKLKRSLQLAFDAVSPR